MRPASRERASPDHRLLLGCWAGRALMRGIEALLSGSTFAVGDIWVLQQLIRQTPAIHSRGHTTVWSTIALAAHVRSD